MIAAGEGPEHANGVFRILRFPEDVVVKGDGGVGRQDDAAWRLKEEPGDGAGFLFRQTLDVVNGRFARTTGFVDGDGLDGMRDAGCGQDFVAARGAGGEDEHFTS